jgi:hypothetical protein
MRKNLNKPDKSEKSEKSEKVRQSGDLRQGKKYKGIVLMNVSILCGTDLICCRLQSIRNRQRQLHSQLAPAPALAAGNRTAILQQKAAEMGEDFSVDICLGASVPCATPRIGPSDSLSCISDICTGQVCRSLACDTSMTCLRSKNRTNQRNGEIRRVRRRQKQEFPRISLERGAVAQKHISSQSQRTMCSLV